MNGSDPSGRNALLVTMVEVEEDVAPMEAADLSLGQTASLSLRKPWGAASEYMFLMVGMAGQFGARSSATVVSTALNIDCIWVEESSIMDIGAEVASGADVSGIQASSQQCESLPKRKRPCKCDQPGDQGHHLLPFGGGKMELLFNKCGVDVNDLQYMVCLAGPDHTEVHGAGYNPNWLQWLLGAIKSGTCNPTTVRQHLLDLLKGPGSPFAGPLNSGRKCTNSPTAPFGYSPMRAM